MVREALAAIDIESIAEGFRVADTMVKDARCDLLTCSPVTPGRFLIVVAGPVGEVESAYKRALREARGVNDEIFLPVVHPALIEALALPDIPEDLDALGLFETQSLSSCLAAADTAVKGSTIRLLHVYLSRGIQGKGFILAEGSQDMVEAACTLARRRAGEKWVNGVVIPRPHIDFMKRLRERPWGWLAGQEIL
ncbi:MAG: BMC domain-containing protein [Candidatus Eisenbacteria bacterium]|uniref:BMC domain-containing protein n=1 Tax=Eiseniibacteriota bacterium TaxID=2212470 RepID=A0A948RY06_UNCEI|nr:BMC domain-containing protein [Candidatus Eisenbacteria bacterium]MBU1951185.1 BMC domain-containing protein [Candidatus Eisenbacteria bacterium]MBU2690319.1 BMC domain-containing protein [Candidatus Eisenbacteria bacterium]